MLSDGKRFQKLAALNSELGLHQFSFKYLEDPINSMGLIYDHFEGMALEHTQKRNLIGVGLIKYGDTHLGGKPLPYGHLNSIFYNGRQAKKSLKIQFLDQLIQQTHQQLKQEGLILAFNLESRSNKSFLLQQNWYDHYHPERIDMYPVRLRRQPVIPPDNHYITAMQDEDIDPVVELMNDFYKSYELYPQFSQQDIRNWLAKRLKDDPINHYWLVKDQHSNILAGVGLSEYFHFRSTQIKGMRLSKLFNGITRKLPAGGQFRELAVSKFWYLPGQEQAVKYLWEQVRYSWRNRANTLMLYLDVNSPFRSLLELPTWPLTAQLGIAIKGPRSLSTDRLVYVEAM